MPCNAARGYPPLVYLFCRETRHAANTFSARFFFEAHGVREDPATGNGAAFLGAYLLAHRLVPDAGFCARIEQGYELGRPSLVRLRGRMDEGRVEVSVGGSVLPTVRGELV
jgi:trans-2,3-dihydro-3-hydroxyanthranilate isomerase